MGATACIVIPWFADRYAETRDWRPLAWFIHDRLPYSRLCFFPKLAAFNIQWHERPARRIDSYVNPKGCLTRAGDAGLRGRSRGNLCRLPALPGLAGFPSLPSFRPERSEVEKSATSGIGKFCVADVSTPPLCERLWSI